jgi:SAM-dependent methyltransferase
MASEQHDVRRQLTELLGGVRRGFCLRALAQFQIPDQIAMGSKTSEELAAATGLDHEALDRVLNVMGDIGILQRDASGAYSNSEISSLLRDGVEGSLRNYVLFRTDNSMLTGWMALPSVLKDGQPAFAAVHGTPVFPYMKEHPELFTTFNGMMNEVYHGDGERLAEGFDFGRFGSVLDVGGGLGHVIAEILSTHSNVKGGLYDLSAVADAAEKFLAERKLSDRCYIGRGDFFESVPDGYDAYFLKSVIHDWNDELSIKILKNCRNAMPANGRLLIAEQTVSSSDDLYPDRYADLEMMVLVGGKERSREDFEKLLGSSGFELVDCHAVDGTSFSIIEGKPL